jgi:ATP-binding cassette subfamily B protein
MSSEEPKRLKLSPFRDRRTAVSVIAVLSLITGFFETMTIVAIVAYIDGVASGNLRWEIAKGPFDLTLDRSQLALLSLLSLLGTTVGQLMSNWLKARAVSGWALQLRLRAVRAYLAADWATQSSDTSGSLQTLINRTSAASSTLGGLMTLMTAGGAVLIFGVASFLASPLAAGVLVVAGTLIMMALRPLRMASRAASRAAAIANGEVADHLGEIHDLAQEIRVHQARRALDQQVTRQMRRSRTSSQRSSVLTGMSSILYRSVGLAVVLFGAVIASQQDDLAVARFGVAGLLLLRSLSYGQSIQSAWLSIQNSRPQMEMVSDSLEMYESRAEKRGTRKIDDFGDLKLEQVSYSYDEEAPALHQLDITVRSGETLGVVGPSGGGKSTLAQVLLGLREPSSGSYLVGGVPATDVEADSWFRRVTVVPQQTRLLRASVLENIVFYRPWVSSDAARKAAQAAGLHDEIEALPDGYETLIGDAIRDLSGGQRQRLGIARALAGEPQLLVLDEPTSALDAKSESRVQETLALLKGRVTVVIIAHRLATLNNCDRLLVLEAGVVQALDAPAMVMQQSDFYRDAVKMQLVGGADAGSAAMDEDQLNDQP